MNLSFICFCVLAEVTTVVLLSYVERSTAGHCGFETWRGLHWDVSGDVEGGRAFGFILETFVGAFEGELRMLWGLSRRGAVIIVVQF